MADQNEPTAPEPNAVGASPDSAISPNEIESLLNEVARETEQSGASPAQPTAPQSPPPTQVSQTMESTDDQAALRQDDIEKLLGSIEGAAPKSAGPAASPGVPGVGSTGVDTVSPPTPAPVGQGDIECLLDQAEEALRSIDTPGDAVPAGAITFQFQEFAGTSPGTETATLDLLSDVDLDLKIELGRTHMYLEDVLKLRRGAVVPLDKLAGDPVDIYVNDRLIARGEVLVLNDNFCVRVAELIAGSKIE